MSKIIKIPDALYERLGKHITGFDDTPAIIIERLLDNFEGVEHPKSETSTAEYRQTSTFGSKDYTRYFFNGQSYGKNRLVLAIVQKFVNDHPNIGYEGLLSAFPKSLQGSIGVVNPLKDVEKKYHGKSNMRHFIKEDEVLHLSDTNAVVCTEWGLANIDDFINAATRKGYSITT